ncbi:MAG TPA: ATP-binding protein [Candidatus Limnocylindrales bacterium]|nr:ATP-binding protein [Candidatus Limnocylindrales bacterium]
MTASAAVALLGLATTAMFVAIAALTIRDWLATKDVSRMYLALAIGSLAAVSILGQAAQVLGPWFAGLDSALTIVIFLGSGLALLLFRDSVIPLPRRTRRLVIGVVAGTALLNLVIQLAASRTAPRPLLLLGEVAFVVVWSGCVGEPSLRLWLASRPRTAVQRSRMRALSLGYLGIVAILLSAVFAGSFGSTPAVRIAIALATLAIVPLLYAGFVPPTWLRRVWRHSEEGKFRQATHDIVLFAADRATFAARALDWAVRLSGADAGFFRSAGTIIATQGMTAEAAMMLAPRVATAAAHQVLPLGGTPPRSAIVAQLAGANAAIVLVGGPFTPIFGTDEEAWLRHYAALVSTGLDRVRLVEELNGVNVELEKTVKAVTEQTRQLEAANQELEAFSYSVSHDLRAPLRAISGYTGILLEEYSGALPEEGLGFLKRVKDNSDHMGRLIDDLLAFSRLGRQAVRPQRLRTRAVVDRALAQLGPQDGRQVEVVIGDLPDCESDPGLLEQVFVNLLSNAFKYSRRRDDARIEVGAFDAATGSEGPVFFVRDNGAGFDMRYVDKLFGVFQRLHRSQDYEGTGVGLAIVKRIVARHGGRVWAEAKVGEGATFYFTLGRGGSEWQPAIAA